MKYNRFDEDNSRVFLLTIILLTSPFTMQRSYLLTIFIAFLGTFLGTHAWSFTVISKENYCGGHRRSFFSAFGDKREGINVTADIGQRAGIRFFFCPAVKYLGVINILRVSHNGINLLAKLI